MKRIEKLIQNRKMIYAFAALVAGLLCALVFCYVVFVNLGSIKNFFSGVVRVLSPVIIGLVLLASVDNLTR